MRGGNERREREEGMRGGNERREREEGKRRRESGEGK